MSKDRVPRDRVGIVHVHLDVENSVRDRIAAPLTAAGREVVWLDDRAKLERALPEIRALACGGLGANDGARAKALELVQILGSGVDHVPMHELAPEVQVVNARGIHAAEMRDHALAMMLHFARDVPRLTELQARARWAPFAGDTLAGRTLAVLGLGHVGRAVAAAGRALGMHVVGTRRSGVAVPEAHETWGPAGTAEALGRADYAVVCLPLTADTRGLLAADMLALLPARAVLVVLSRGGIVDEDALAERLTRGELHGAALDVFATEPLPDDHRLWSTPRLLLSPHVAGRSEQNLTRSFEVFASNVERWEAGIPLLTPVDRERGY